MHRPGGVGPPRNLATAPRYNSVPMPASSPETPHPVRLHNSLSREVEQLVPHTPGLVRIYTCGPTVYRYAHIGNLRSFLFADILRRSLEYLGYAVRRVKNTTEVGHMRDNTFDTGEDRMELAAELEGKTPTEIAQFYTDAW